jgi:hypothetical protein
MYNMYYMYVVWMVGCGVMEYAHGTRKKRNKIIAGKGCVHYFLRLPDGMLLEEGGHGLRNSQSTVYIVLKAV